jgi:hypothetical protein
MGTARQPKNGQTGRPRNEEQGDAGGTALTAIERLIQMLEEEVLPNLSEEEDAEAIDDPDALNGGETSDAEEAAFAAPLAQRDPVPEGRIIPGGRGNCEEDRTEASRQAARRNDGRTPLLRPAHR